MPSLKSPTISLRMNFKSAPLNKRRSRRLRKKLHVGEFKEEGFEVNFKYKANLTNEAQLDVLMKFITEVIESRNLAFGGGENGFITRAGRGSTMEEDRQAVRSWLLACGAIEHVRVNESKDAWY